MSQGTLRRWRGTIGPLQIAIIVLVAITALVHLQRGIGMSAGRFGGGPPGGASGAPPPGMPGGPPGGASDGFNIMQALPLPLPTLFLLNGIGYLALVVALYLPALSRFQRLVRWLLIIFTVVTIVMYFAVAGLAPNPIGLIDKVIEIALIALLFIEDRQARRATVDVGYRGASHVESIG